MRPYIKRKILARRVRDQERRVEAVRAELEKHEQKLARLRAKVAAHDVEQKGQA